MSTLLARLALPALLALGLLVPGDATAASARTSATCSAAAAVPTGGNLPAVRGAVLCLVNSERAARGLRRLRSSRALRRAAVRHSADMAARRYFRHTSPTGATASQRIMRAGYGRGVRAWSTGENLAWGAGARASAVSVVGAWMRSPGHRANILRSGFRELGVGIVVAGSRAGGRVLYTTNFGARA